MRLVGPASPRKRTGQKLRNECIECLTGHQANIAPRTRSRDGRNANARPLTPRPSLPPARDPPKQTVTSLPGRWLGATDSHATASHGDERDGAFIAGCAHAVVSPELTVNVAARIRTELRRAAAIVARTRLESRQNIIPPHWPSLLNEPPLCLRTVERRPIGDRTLRRAAPQQHR
jgi:hypothetical protein